MHQKISPLVSVVMCVYNGEQFLEEQLKSVLQQSYTNLELLILDDCSTDSTLTIATTYAKTDSRIRVIQNETNLGFNRNFEKGIHLSQGDFIAICDQDDVWLPTKLEELVNSIGNAVLIYSNSALIDEQGNYLNKTLNHNLIHLDKPKYQAFLESNFITGHTCLFKKELVQYILPLPATITYYDWWIAMVAAYVGEIKYLDKVLTNYRIHTASVIQQEKLAQESKQIVRAKRWQEIKAFSQLHFIRPHDKAFMDRFLQKKEQAGKGIHTYFSCYLFLLQHQATLYPWYAKPFYKKLNFIRQQCV